jgi:spermidine synthase
MAYSRTMLVGLAVHDKPQRVLVVGLGGGTIPTWLHRHFPKTLIDVVEIDPEVVDVAKNFFGFRPDEKLKAHVQDGRKFIEQTRDPYDVIFLDAFSADSIPYHLATQEFLKAVRKAIKPDGLVVSNVWSRQSNKLYDSMVKTYQSVFNEVYVVNVPDSGNRILLSLRTSKNLSRQFLADHSHRLFTDQKLTFDFDRLVEQGYEDKLELDSGAILLKDHSPDKPPYSEDGS